MSRGINKRLAITALAGSCGGLLFGYDIGAISSATPELRTHFALLASALGIAVSSALFGTIAGSIAAGFVADAKLQRCPAFQGVTADGSVPPMNIAHH